MACCCNNSFRDIKLRLNGKSIIASNKSDGLEEHKGMVVNISCNSRPIDERRPRPAMNGKGTFSSFYYWWRTLWGLQFIPSFLRTWMVCNVIRIWILMIQCKWFTQQTVSSPGRSGLRNSHDGEETDLVNIYLERWVRKLHLAINHLSIPELELLQNIHFVESESP